MELIYFFIAAITFVIIDKLLEKRHSSNLPNPKNDEIYSSKSTNADINGGKMDQSIVELNKLIDKEKRYAQKRGSDTHYYSFIESDRSIIIDALKSGKSITARCTAYSKSKEKSIPVTRFKNYVRLFSSDFKDVQFQSDDEMFTSFIICVAKIELEKHDKLISETKREYQKTGLLRFDNLVKTIPVIIAVILVISFKSCSDGNKTKFEYCEKVNPRLDLTNLRDSAQCDAMYKEHKKYNENNK